MSDVDYIILSSDIKEALKYIAAAAVGGVIGNRADAWFMSLFYHQRKRLIEWLTIWKPKISDLDNLLKDERLKILFSSIIADISNEINDTKFAIWPDITDSMIRRQDLPLDEKQYFVSLFKRLDTFSLQYLASLYYEKGIDYTEIFNVSESQPDIGSRKHILYLGQLQCSTTGLTTMDSTRMNLTRLGEGFVNFISEESRKKLKIAMEHKS